MGGGEGWRLPPTEGDETGPRKVDFANNKLETAVFFISSIFGNRLLFFTTFVHVLNPPLHVFCCSTERDVHDERGWESVRDGQAPPLTVVLLGGKSRSMYVGDVVGFVRGQPCENSFGSTLERESGNQRKRRKFPTFTHMYGFPRRRVRRFHASIRPAKKNGSAVRGIICRRLGF